MGRDSHENFFLWRVIILKKFISYGCCFGVFFSQFWVLFCYDLEGHLFVLSLTQKKISNSNDLRKLTQYLN